MKKQPMYTEEELKEVRKAMTHIQKELDIIEKRVKQAFDLVEAYAQAKKTLAKA